MRGLLLAPEDMPYGLGICQIRGELFVVSGCCTFSVEDDGSGNWECGNCRKPIWFPLGIHPPDTEPCVRLNGASWVPSDIFNLVETWTGLERKQYELSIDYGYFTSRYS